LPRTAPKHVEILLIEDNPADVRLTMEAFKEAGIANTLTAITNGQDALDFLYRRKKYADAVRPDLILLDLNLPGISGYEVLDELKSDADLRMIPVVVLTSSEAESDIVRSYKLHANCYIVKPVNFDGLKEVIQTLDNFWFTIVHLP
jgi:two-component system, chemotaxis family, response regulator Rcp1